MTSKIKNIIIVSVVVVALVLVYIFFLKPAPDTANLVSSTSSAGGTTDVNVISQNSAVTQDLLSVLLSVKSIKLDDSIFSDKAFMSLHDSSILLTSPGDEGRPNPFAPIGFEAATTPVVPVVPPPATPQTITLPTTPTTPITPTTPPATQKTTHTKKP